MPNCERCNKPLKAIGHARENGKNHPDWAKRTLHKKCWKEEQDYKATQRYINFYNLFKN